MAKHKRAITGMALLFTVFAMSVLPAGAIEPVSVEKLIEEALKANPEITAARRNSEAASARIWQAASLSDPMLEMEYNKIYADRDLSGNPMKMYSLTQDVPFPTKLFLRAKIAAKLAKMAYENYKAKERDIISQVKSTYADLFLVYRSIDVANEEKGLLDQFSRSATTRYSAGEGSQSDALKAQVELAGVDTRLIMLEQRRLTTQAKLNILINRDPKEEIGTPLSEGAITFDRPLEEFYVLARNNSPELKAYRYAIERGKASYDLSLNEFMPDLRIKFQQMVRRDRVNEKMWAGALGVTIPLWFFEKQAFGVKEMRSELEMLKSEYRAKENLTLFDVRDSFARVEANKKVVELYETAFIPQANETLKAALKGYESGKVDFLTLLDSERMLIGFKLDHYNAILRLRIALADLERSIGTGIEKTAERGKDEKSK